ncbi:negative regulation of dendritic cell differentiation [Branchiostoma belcheri]|nr:negative regulation of dendritic cell differentiation [Branchiostoma belcheri]
MAALPPSPHSYKSLVYQRTLLDRLNFLRNLGLFCDVTLEVEGKLFRCHQVILAASSTFFQTLFTQQQAAIKQAQPIDLPVVKATAFLQLLDFVYTSELSLTVQTAIDLLSAASLLQMGPLVEAVSHYLKTHVASLLQMGPLVEAVSHYLKTHVGDEPEKPLPPLSSASGPAGHLLPSPPPPALDRQRHTPTSREPSAFVLHDSGQYVQQERERSAQTSASTPSPTLPHPAGLPSHSQANLRLSPNADKGRAPLDYGPPLVMPPLPTHQPGFRYGVRSLDGKGGVFPVPIEVGNPYNRRHEQRFECHVCYMKFTRSETLRDHMNIHTGEKPYSCKFCHKKFRHQRNLRTHERDCKDNKGSKWRRKYTETVKDALERISVTITAPEVQHYEEFRGQEDDPIDLQEDRRSTPDSLGGEHNLEIDETSPDVTMETCDDSPDVAMAMGGGNPDVGLDGERFTDEQMELEYRQRMQSLNQHGTPANRIRKHEARYSCNICLQTFTRSHNLKNHMLIHSDAKPFTCPRCSGEFRYKRNLKAHSSVCKGIISVQNTAHPARSMSGSEPDLDAPPDCTTFAGIRDLLTSDDPEDQVEGQGSSGDTKEQDIVFSSPNHSPEDSSKPCTYIRGQDGRIIAVKQESPTSPPNGQAELSEHGSREENVWVPPGGGENSAEDRLGGGNEGSVEHIARTPTPGNGENQAVGGARKRKAAVQHRWDTKHPGVARLPEQLQSYVMEMMGEGGRGAPQSSDNQAAPLEQSVLSQNENQIIKDFWAEVNRGLFPDDHFSGLGHPGAKVAPDDQWQGGRTQGHRHNLEIQTSPSIDPLRDGGSPLLESDSSVVQNWAGGDKSAGRKKQNGARVGRSKGRGEQETFDPKRVKVETQDNA